MADTIYIKIGQKIRVTQPSVSIGELGDLWCANASIQAHCKALHYTTVYLPTSDNCLEERILTS